MRFVLALLSQYQYSIWGFTVAVQAAFLIYLLVRRSSKDYPLFCFYVFAGILQAGVLKLTYWRWGFDSVRGWEIAWTTQVFVVSSRAAAVGELCHKVLAPFHGIWGLAWRILLGTAALVVILALVLGGHDWVRIATTVDLGLECGMATAIVILFLFARYYHLPLTFPQRWMGLAFCLYSCFRILNDAVFQHYMQGYASVWTLADGVGFLMCLALWIRAMWKWNSERSTTLTMLPSAIYEALIPQVNQSLLTLNEQLSRLWKHEAKRA